jgi:hypothetical protein
MLGGLVVFSFEVRRGGSKEWKAIDQTVPIVWTGCHLGGRRPWFSCVADVAGESCGRRVAILYLHDDQLVFACRACSGLVYRSQQLCPSDRAQWRAQKLRKRLSGSRNSLPEKPPRMHWSTFHRLVGKVIAAQENSTALSRDRVRRRFPGLLSDEDAFDD